MSKKKFIKGNLHRGDNLRALVTDTFPADVPIIFSNDGFYRNAKNRGTYSDVSKQILDKILNSGDARNYTIPYRYRISKNTMTTRRLSLLHPRSQIKICDFYREYEELICHYNSQSSFSIRAPIKVGSTFFYKCSVSEKNKYKGSSIDTLKFEGRVRNPASYFAYKGEDRLYKFFESSRFVQLEKKFGVMWLADVSKCFDSIYTHTLLWAVKDMPTAKASIRYKSFGAEFDKLMQKQNYNETNGICIGPETSRIFAETILQKIDQLVVLEANKYSIHEKVDYECVRYVDDIIIFAKNDSIAEKIYSIFEECLGHFNLHLNDLKLDKYKRPFCTKKSIVVQCVKENIDKLRLKIIEQAKTESGTFLVPQHIFRSQVVRNNFIKDIKFSCHSAGVGYDMASNYLAAGLSNLLEEIVEKYPLTPEDIRPSDERYIALLLLLLELQFFFYTVQPTVSMSFRLARAIVLSVQFFKTNVPKRLIFLSEQLSRWTYDLLRSLEHNSEDRVKLKVPIEVLNIVLALSEADTHGNFNAEFVRKTILNSSTPDYFAIISFLFFVKNKPLYSTLKKELETYLMSYFSTKADVMYTAHDAHLFLDIAACPYLSKKTRSKIIQFTNNHLGLQVLNLTVCEGIAKELEQMSWFTNWNGIDLLSMIRRKELSFVY